MESSTYDYNRNGSIVRFMSRDGMIQKVLQVLLSSYIFYASYYPTMAVHPG